MKPFTKRESIAVTVILLVIAGVTAFNIRIALRRARDAQRSADLGAISNALHDYFADFGYFPPAEDGMIKACRGNNFDQVLAELEEAEEFDSNLFFSGLKGCEWGKDGLSDLDLFGKGENVYLKTIHKDPRTDMGFSYLYLSNTRRFQLYSYLEGESEEESYNPGMVKRGLNCGSKTCSYGKTYADTPLDRSIEEFEKELLEKQKLLDLESK